MELLWPEQGQESAANNLHKALHTARHVLEPQLPSKAVSRYIQLQGDLVVLRAPGSIRIDIEEFQSLAELARISNEPDDYDRALSIYTGDLLPQDAYEDWAILSRERLKHLRLEVLLGLAQVLEEREEIDGAVQTLRQVLEVDHAHEEAHGRLMLLLARSGHRQLALRQYLQLVSALEEELGAQPDPVIQRLFQDIRDNRLQVPSSETTPPIRVAPSRMREVPQPHVIGREQEVSELCKYLSALQEGIGNLVIVQGEAGTGKTHLMTKIVEYAAQQGIATLAGRSADTENATKYRQLASALSNYADSSPFAPRSAQQAVKLAQILTSMSSWSPGQWGSDITSLGNVPLEVAIVDFFKQVSASTPALLILEDLHLADDEALRLIQALANIVDNSALLIVGTAQPPGTEGYNDVLDLFRGCTTQAISILSLHSLGYSETVSLVTQVLGAPADRGTLELIHSLSDGVPHYIRETALALAGRGGLQLVEGQWVLRPDIPPRVERHTLRQPSSEHGAHVSFLVRDRLLQDKDTA
jgi:DNA-binding SARP family transcriptional activator